VPFLLRSLILLGCVGLGWLFGFCLDELSAGSLILKLVSTVIGAIVFLVLFPVMKWFGPSDLRGWMAVSVYAGTLMEIILHASARLHRPWWIGVLLGVVCIILGLAANLRSDPASVPQGTYPAPLSNVGYVREAWLLCLSLVPSYVDWRAAKSRMRQIHKDLDAINVGYVRGAWLLCLSLVPSYVDWRAAKSRMRQIHKDLDAGDLHAALLKLRVMVAECEKVAGPQDPITMEWRHCLADTLYELGQISEALRVAKINLDGRVAVIGRTHPDTKDSQHLYETLLHEIEGG
jgi:hypothetical protein